jgi:hypothetical protein
LKTWGRLGFDWCREALAACRGLRTLVKYSVKSLPANDNFALAA